MYACGMQIMKPPAGTQMMRPPSRQQIAERLAAGKTKPKEGKSSQQEIQAKVSSHLCWTRIRCAASVGLMGIVPCSEDDLVPARMLRLENSPCISAVLELGWCLQAEVHEIVISAVQAPHQRPCAV